MAGYVFSVSYLGDKKNPSDSEKNESILKTIQEAALNGCFSVRMFPPASSQAFSAFAGTLADFLSMKEGDNIYFFGNRKYYGIGELVNVGQDCKYENYPGSTSTNFPQINEIKDTVIINKDEDTNKYKWFCTFKGAPAFFEEGVDGDDVLMYKPDTFKSLRNFSSLSFIKLSDEENNSLREIILLRHQQQVIEKAGAFVFSEEFHKSLRHKRLKQYQIKLSSLLGANLSKSNQHRLNNEMLLEAATVDALTRGTSSTLGKWDYVTHQVAASPFKPIEYMDMMDIFAYQYLPGYTIPCKYLIAELKREKADINTVDQVMKYVDWVRSEYTYGDYGAIKACIIAFSFSRNIKDYIAQHVHRNYAFGQRPTKNMEWSDISLIQYRYNDGKIEYSLV